jgi:hypothetical protein
VGKSFGALKELVRADRKPNEHILLSTAYIRSAVKRLDELLEPSTSITTNGKAVTTFAHGTEVAPFPAATTNVLLRSAGQMMELDTFRNEFKTWRL